MGYKGTDCLVGCRSRCGLGGGLCEYHEQVCLTPPPRCGTGCLGGGGVTFLFLLCGGLLFLLYIPHLVWALALAPQLVRGPVPQLGSQAQQIPHFHV